MSSSQNEESVSQPDRQITCIAPINIAIVKYWGKQPNAEGERLVLPLNDSLSVTLSCELLRTKTLLEVSTAFEADTMCLNGVHTPVNKRIGNMLALVRMTGAPTQYKVRITTENNFPTAAGMASSASGCAALATALCKLFPESSVDPSLLARVGSGSACRSVFGGFVRWVKSEVSEKCVAVPVYPASHWPELQVLCLVVGAHQKDVSSTDGMQRSAQTSPMMPDRVERVVPERVKQLTQAIGDRNFDEFARIAMCESDDLHAVCRTSVPSIVYLNEASFDIVRAVHKFNEIKGGARRLAYSFDAGPNAFLFTTRENLCEVLAFVRALFPATSASDCILEASAPKMEEVGAFALDKKVVAEAVNDAAHMVVGRSEAALALLFHSSVGEGPRSV
eukprot:PhM_4_TR6947/c0_g1_i1/m.39005/K01597/MVD, mvaD; diphosphomevalonate decarboxylase